MAKLLVFGIIDAQVLNAKFVSGGGFCILRYEKKKTVWY